jgi:hypothetical protein
MPSLSNELLLAVNALRQVPQAPWRAKVRRVAVILTSSRSGSSLLKSVLAGHPAIAALDGEAEPYLTLSGNGFGFNSDSDAITTLAQADQLADNIFDGLGVPCADMPTLPQLEARWCRRLLLQFPALFSQPDEQRRLLHALDEALGHARQQQHQLDERALHKTILSAVFWRTPWRLDYYDGKLGPGVAPPFAESAKLEEPPFVLPALYRRPFTSDDAHDKVLLFKTPSDAYRPGIYRQLFPNADIRYVHLTRGFAQTVNGLMDGWLSPHGFFAHDMEQHGTALAIGGYSERLPFGRRWWKFDLPPNWRAFTGASLDQVCLNQWLSCHRAILDSGVSALRVSFEDFIAQPAQVANRLCDWLGLAPLPTMAALPVTMATDMPAPGRWAKRRALLAPLAEQSAVADMMDALGYRLEPEEWQ